MSLLQMAGIGVFIILCLFLGQFAISIFIMALALILAGLSKIWEFIKKLFS